MTDLNKLKELGEVLTCDILVVGGGTSGISTAIVAKENNPDADVLIVETGVTGYAGQSTKAGHGYFCLLPELDVEDYVKFAVNVEGEFLNDQDLVRRYGEEGYESLLMLDRWGVNVPKGADGKPYINWIAPHYTVSNADSDMALHMRRRALEIGIRIKNKTQVFDILTEGDRAVGVTAMNMLDGSFCVIRAKAIALCTAGCHFKISGPFRGYGDMLLAAWNVGAEMRNAEFCVQTDIINRKNGEKLYGSQQVIFNRKGENLCDKYSPNASEPTHELVLGMIKEIAEGNGPLYADMTIQNQQNDMVGYNNEEAALRLGPHFLSYERHLMRKFMMSGIRPELKPEVSVTFTMQMDPLKVDHEMRTTVPGLWAAGAICIQGSSFLGWQHGDGIGNAIKSSMHCGRNIAEYVKDASLGDVDYEQAAAYKEAIYAPINRTKGMLPQEYFDRIAPIIAKLEYNLLKTDENMLEATERIKEIETDMPQIMARDWHELAKCREVQAVLTCAQMYYRASYERKESRGYTFRHDRADYPKRNDKEWLKWINLKKADDGGIDVYFEPVPIENYRYKPEGM